MACRHFQGIFMVSVFLKVSALRDRMCICNTAHTRHGKYSSQGSPPRHPARASRSRNKLRARSPLPFSQRDFAHAQNHLPEMHAGRPGKCEKKEVMGCIRRRNQSHSPGCIGIHCARIHTLRFWRVCWGFVTCFTRFPSETRSARLSGARNETLW